MAFGARSFNGSSDYIINASGPTLVGVPITLSCWIYPTSIPGGGAVALMHGVGAGVGDGTYQMLTGFFGDSTAFIDSRQGGVTDSSAVTSTTVTTNGWNHICGWSKGNGTGGQKIYLNGGNSGTAAGISGDGSATRVGFVVGALAFSNTTFFSPFPGRIADAAIWNVALTDVEIAALAAGVRPKDIRPASLIGYWPCDGVNSPESDLSGLANNGTLTGTINVAGPPLMLSTPRWPENPTFPVETPPILFAQSVF